MRVKRDWLGFVIVATMLPLTAGQAMAQTDTLDELVVTASGGEKKPKSAPASVSVIGQQELQRNRYADLGEALEAVEGVDVRQSTGKTGGLNISIRGLPSEYSLILIDGRRQNPPGSVTPNGFGDTSTSFIPPVSAIERIEVIRGPMSTLYGSDAMGGVVNIITKKVADEWASSFTVEQSIHEDRDYGETGKTSFYSNGPLVDGVLGMAVRGSVSDRAASELDFEDGSEVTRRGASPVEGRKYSIGGRLSLTPVTNHDFFLDLEKSSQVYNNDDCQLGTLDGRDRSCDEDPGEASGYADELRFEREQVVLGHTGRLDFGSWENSLSQNTTETDGRTIPGTIGQAYEPPYQQIVGGAGRRLESTDRIFDSKLVAPVHPDHIVTLGAQYRQAELEDGLAGETFSQNSRALFAEDEWYLRDDLALTVGGRYEDHDAFSGHFTPRAYLVWDATRHWTVKGGVSQGYRTPDLNDLHDGINGVTGQGDQITIGTPGLEPEKSTSSEIGVYYDALDGFNANATVFHTEFKDKITDGNQVRISGDPRIPDGLYDQLANVGRAQTQGVELAGRWRFASDWSLSGNYTYTDSEQKSGANEGAPLTNTPEHMAHARLNWDASEQLSLWLMGEYRGDRTRYVQARSELGNEERAVLDQVGELQAYVLFHLGGSYRVADNVTLTATVNNLLDTDFREGNAYSFTDENGDTQTGWASDYVYIFRGMASGGTIEEGRHLWVSATMEF